LRFEVRGSKYLKVVFFFLGQFFKFARKSEIMATIRKFEDLEVWQLARQQVKDFNEIVDTTTLGKNFSLRNQMDESSGSVMDCIAEGFDRSGNKEFRNFLLISKGSNAEYRSQLYRCVDRNHISIEKFELMRAKNEVIGNKLMSFSNYLQTTTFKGQRYKL
jgi:four helix bundle protein